MEGCWRKWLGGTPVCRGLPIRLCFTYGDLKQSFRLLAVFGLQLSYIYFLSIRVSLESCRSVCGNSSFVVPLVTWHLELDFSVQFTYHKELPTG